MRHLSLILLLFYTVTGQPARAAETLDLVTIPAGVAQLGDPNGDANEVVRSEPVKAFRMMRREVTNAQFSKFVEDTGYSTTVEGNGKAHVWSRRWRSLAGATWRHPQGPGSNLDGLDDHPVVQVSAWDAEAFCRHHGLRLPSDTEWEYAARGTQGHRFAWGDQAPAHDFVNYGSNKCCAADDADGFERTSPVGHYFKGRTETGLDDMAGNVWEWTSSRFPDKPEWRVIKGGGWGNDPYGLRASYRHGNPPEFGLDMVGFRCAGDIAAE